MRRACRLGQVDAGSHFGQVTKVLEEQSNPGRTSASQEKKKRGNSAPRLLDWPVRQVMQAGNARMYFRAAGGNL
jgi:hypothetical protein